MKSVLGQPPDLQPPRETIMSKKRGRKRKNPTTLVNIRRQVLPSESLVDVFDYIGRRELDRWGTVSHQYYAAIECARPLRNVEKVVVDKHLGSGLYKATIFAPKDDGVDEENRVQRNVHVSNRDFNEFVELLFDVLRFCNVTGGVYFAFVRFDCAFVEHLKAIKLNFRCEDKCITLQNVGLGDDVCPLDLLSSFPSFRSLNRGTYLLLRSRFRAEDAFLKALALHGIWDHSDLVGHDENLLHAGSITDEGMLDFAFGKYGNDANERHLVLNRPSMSPQFMRKLIEACRVCKGSHRLVVDITTPISQQLDIDDFIVYGHQHTMRNGLPMWKFSFPDLPDVRIHYAPKDCYDNYPLPTYGKFYCWRNCAP